MDLHVVLPAEQPETNPDAVVELARRAEVLGYTGIYLPDHLLPPEPFGGSGFNGVYEPLTMLSYIAASTRRLRLGTSVLLLSMRSPFVVAKQVATLNRLSHGRVTLGIGLGWSEAEFANVGASFADRATRTDEGLRLMRHLWSGDPGPFDSQRFGFRRGHFQPRPEGGLRILVGGMSDAALRRAAREADVWQSPPVEPAQFAERVAVLRRLTDRPIQVGGRLEWTGDPAEPGPVAEAVAAWAAAGADELAVWFGPLSGFGERMTALARAGVLTGSSA